MRRFWILISLLPCISGFTFTVSDISPSQCGELSIKWSGGTPPFRLLILPAFDYPSNISLPQSSWTDGTGSYQWTVNYPSGTELLFVMSDAVGVGTGGVTALYKVTTGSTACELRSTNVDFYFYLNETSVNQCDPVQIYWDSTASAPVTIFGAIPGGQPFTFEAPASTTALDWRTNIAAGTQFILAEFDSGRYGTGGSSALMTVGASGSNSCLDDSSPSSTPAGSPSATDTGTSARIGGVKTVTAITTATPQGAAGLSTGAIAGIAVAAIAVVLVLQGVLFYFCCRKQFRALLSHRRQMKDRAMTGREVDLAESDAATSLRSVALHDTFTLMRGSDHDASSISPYWDMPRSADGRGPFDTPPEDDSPRFRRESHHWEFPPIKAQLARESAGPSRQPLELPPGGIRLDEDAGRVDSMEELPPLYKPEWESESQHSFDRERS